MSMTTGLGLRELNGTSEVNLIYSGRDLFGSGFFLPIAYCPIFTTTSVSSSAWSASPTN